MKIISRILLGSIAFGITGVVSAETNPRPTPNRQGPPAEAIAACENKTIGNQCSFTARRGGLTGQCAETPRGIMTCRPEGRGQRQRGSAERGERPQRRDHRTGEGRLGVRQDNTQRRPGRSHSILTKAPLNLVPATVNAIANNRVTIDIVGDQRIIKANGVASHKTGAFPNSGNPHSISEQKHSYAMPLNPTFAAKPTLFKVGKIGIAINGVLIEPATAEVYKEAREWRYEALSGAVPLGIDENHAHVQPGGLYHYHGLPTGLMKELGIHQSKHSPLIGWAADGFPIYALFGYKNTKSIGGEIQRESSSYRLIGGERPGGDLPSGKPDGTFTQDYQYVAGAGTLDECNGKMTVTPEYPNGTYAYFITDTFPVIPRCVKGKPSQDFSRRLRAAGNRFLF